MQQYQQQEQSQAQTAQQVQTKQQTSTGVKCSNCGHICEAGALFCEECGMPLGCNTCTSCGIEVEPGWEICPNCGHSLRPDSCTFCGATISPNDLYCPECGNSRNGIECPQCHSLNFRSFCRVCNTPLNAMAMAEVEKAKNDPKFQRMVALAKELAELEDQILEAQAAQETGEDVEVPEAPVLSDEDKALLNQYHDLINAVIKSAPADAPAPKAKEKVEEKVEVKKRKQLTVSSVSIEDTIAIYKQKVAEMNQAMSELIPDPGATPQEQRNYYSARKLPVVTTRVVRSRVPEYWICNYCGCYHRQPSECVEPQLGGTWTYKDITTVETVKTYQYKKD